MCSIFYLLCSVFFTINMAVVLEGIRISSLSDLGDIRQKSDPVLRLEITTENSEAIASVYNGKSVFGEPNGGFS